MVDVGWEGSAFQTFTDDYRIGKLPYEFDNILFTLSTS
jgi:hypothetical protein